ncbi:hypothetical protein, partial [Paraburkholderia guartelaensis]|uniref:hypothetical protein n=1 Tax=Paraburkholderia guartelaensis TaxID=2546446 RepID=UPI002AB626B6
TDIDNCFYVKSHGVSPKHCTSTCIQDKHSKRPQGQAWSRHWFIEEEAGQQDISCDALSFTARLSPDL